MEKSDNILEIGCGGGSNFRTFSKLGLKLYDYSSNFCNNKDSYYFLRFDPVHLSKYGHKYVSNLIIQDKIFK